MENLDKLKEQAETLRVKIYKIEEKQIKDKVLPEAQKIIGQCYKYSNSYGDGEESWWLYQKVISVSSVCGENNVSVLVNEFQQDCHGDIQFKKKTLGYRDLGHEDRWQKVSAEEYQREQKRLIKVLQSL